MKLFSLWKGWGSLICWGCGRGYCCWMFGHFVVFIIIYNSDDSYTFRNCFPITPTILFIGKFLLFKNMPLIKKRRQYKKTYKYDKK